MEIYIFSFSKQKGYATYVPVCVYFWLGKNSELSFETIVKL